MATKSEMHRYWQERSGPKKPKSPPRPRRDTPVDTALPGVSATDRRVGGGSTARRNWSQRAAAQGVYVLEESATGTPSRRSTRKSANRSKPSHPQRCAKVSGLLRARR
jgi:hypothetical protein